MALNDIEMDARPRRQPRTRWAGPKPAEQETPVPSKAKAAPRKKVTTKKKDKLPVEEPIEDKEAIEDKQPVEDKQANGNFDLDEDMDTVEYEEPKKEKAKKKEPKKVKEVKEAKKPKEVAKKKEPKKVKETKKPLKEIKRKEELEEDDEDAEETDEQEQQHQHPIDKTMIIKRGLPTDMDLTMFKDAQVINESTKSKMITLLCTYQDEPAVVRLEKTLFDEEATKKAISDHETHANQEFNNDIYHSYFVSASESAKALNNIKATIIWPATDSVISKYSRSDIVFFSESPDAYLKVVKPFIEDKLETDEDHNKWIYAILDGESEADRVVLNDPDPDSGFMLLPDLKWTGDEKDLNLVAIVHRRDIKSLRDLTDKHLILLKNILTKATKTIKDKFKKADGQLRSYIHYHPSFYHFHVHFKMVDANDYQATDRDNLLSTVINNLSLCKDYYKKSTLTYPLSQSSELYQELKKAKRV